MSERIETSHKGYKIVWSENADEWTCWDAGSGVSSPSLLKLKEKIDRIDLADRKAAAFPCYEISDGHGKRENSKTESQVVQYIGPKIERPMWHEKDRTPKIVGHQVAVVGKRSGNTKASRSQTTLDKLMPDTPEALAAFDLAQQFRRIAMEADAMADLAFKAIPRVEIEQIEKLVKLREQETENGTQD